MAEIGFYHLTRTGLAAALPVLLGRTLAAGERALVLCATREQVALLDEALWLAPHPDWLPHGTAHGPHPQWQPVYLSETEINPAGANFLFLTHGAASPNLGRYRRVFDLFDGNAEAEVAAARTRWQQARAAGLAPVYWRQGDRGWEQTG